LFGHEISGTKPLNKSNLMDLKNNRSGMEFGERLSKQNSGLKNDEVAQLALKEAVQQIRRKNLSVIKPSAAGTCGQLSKKSDSEIQRLLLRVNGTVGA
jgi:hypothetical protein